MPAGFAHRFIFCKPQARVASGHHPQALDAPGYVSPGSALARWRQIQQWVVKPAPNLNGQDPWAFIRPGAPLMASPWRAVILLSPPEMWLPRSSVAQRAQQPQYPRRGPNADPLGQGSCLPGGRAIQPAAYVPRADPPGWVALSAAWLVHQKPAPLLVKSSTWAHRPALQHACCSVTFWLR